MTHFNSKPAMPTNNIKFSCHLKAVKLVWPIMSSISCHIMPLTIITLGADTHTYTNACTHTDVCIKANLRNQVHSLFNNKMICTSRELSLNSSNIVLVTTTSFEQLPGLPDLGYSCKVNSNKVSHDIHINAWIAS